MRQPTRALVLFVTLLSLLLAALAAGPVQAAEGAEATSGRLVSPPELLAPVAEQLCDPAAPGDCLGRIAVVAIALLFAFLTVVEVWQIQAPTTSLTAAGSREIQATPPEGADPGAKAADSNPPPARKGKSILPASSLFSSNFSLTVLSGLGGLAAISVAGDFWGLNDNSAQALFLVFFIGFFLAGLALSAVVRGLDEAVRSRIVLRRTWPSRRPMPEQAGASLRFVRWSGYWLRRVLAWLGSFRATTVVFIDTLFNVLQGRSQVQAALLSETITNHHEALLEAAERMRCEVHQAVIRALQKQGPRPGELAHEDRIQVAVSLLSSDEKEVYYIASERGSIPRPFGPYSVAWVAASQGVARWAKLDSASEKVYFGDHAVLWKNQKGEIPGPRGDLLLKQYYQRRGEEDYEAFIVLPMPWCERGQQAGHRRGLIHISFKEATDLGKLWSGLELSEAPNYRAWRSLLETPGSRSNAREPVTLSLREENAELGSVLFLALESLGEALSHFNDEVYDVYIQSRRHAAAA